MKKWFINLGIISYLTLIFLHGLPFDSLLFKVAKEKTSPVVMGMGIWQGWNMFSPNPLRYDVNIYARLYYQDGTIITKNVEDSLEENFLFPFRRVRWTKWSKDNVRQNSHAVLWKPSLKYMVDKYAEQGNPILRAELIRRWIEVKIIHGKQENMIPLKKWDPKLSEDEVFFKLPEDLNTVARN
ncbi:MAG: hypothetical protein CME70_12630 [Halobacteriovorax sp.]|nr:hypothetical protein [Halobacteriovorax sp.]|tara:strand:+ start:209090 stop:209638 length:549 start_codon:yes stop_codon:yes gene_type:complete